MVKKVKKSSRSRNLKRKGIKRKEKRKLVGKITHYFSRIKVAVIKLSAPLAKGDTIKIVGGDAEFTQPVKSMEVNHQKIEKAKTKSEVGLKVKKKVKEGYKVYKI